MRNIVITEEVGVQLTDKYDVYGESCEYFNARTLFHSGFYELETKQRMLKDALWKYRQRNRYSWDCYGCFDEDRSTRIGLCCCTISLFALSFIIISASQSALNILISIIFCLIALCFLMCFLIRATSLIAEYGPKCCRNWSERWKSIQSQSDWEDSQQSLLSIDEFTTTMTRSGGLYFDDKLRGVFDITVLVNYSENTRHEIIYVQRREKLFDFDAILEIGYNEASNEPDWTEYKLYESMPSYSYNVDENNFCAMIIKYKETKEQQQKRKKNSISISMSYGAGLTPLSALNGHHGDLEGVGRWQDRKCVKGEFMQKMESLESILAVVGLEEQVIVRKEPYEMFHKNPVIKHS